MCMFLLMEVISVAKPVPVDTVAIRSRYDKPSLVCIKKHEASPDMYTYVNFPFGNFGFWWTKNVTKVS